MHKAAGQCRGDYRWVHKHRRLEVCYGGDNKHCSFVYQVIENTHHKYCQYVKKGNKLFKAEGLR